MLVRLNVKDTTSREGKKGKRNIVKIKKDDQIYESKTWHFIVGRFFFIVNYYSFNLHAVRHTFFKLYKSFYIQIHSCRYRN